MAESTTTSELYSKSVTKNDVGRVRDGTILSITVPILSGVGRMVIPPVAPPYWSYQRDMVMRSTLYQEAMWSAAIGIAISKIAAASWQIKGDVPLRVKNMQELFINADGERTGWVGFISKHLQDYLTTDNGAFVEIVRATSAVGSRIIGIRHLDSLRCTRTGDPEVPVLYRDKWGAIHELKDYQVMMFSHLPDPGETYYGVGHCAASLAYPTIYKLSAIETYVREKVSGLRPLAIYVVNGVLDSQLKNAVAAAQDDEVARGLVSYMGAVIIGTPTEEQPGLVTIPLAELPDRFQRKEEFDIALLTYADVLGLDPQELQPLTGQALGTGAQSQVLADKAKGKGLEAWKSDWVHQVNMFIAPDNTTFIFQEKDYRDITQKVGISKAYADLSARRIQAGLTTPQQELQLLVDADELPPEFLEEDKVTGTTVSDDDSSEEADQDSKHGKMAEQPKPTDEAKSGQAKPDQQKPAPKPDAAKPQTVQKAKELLDSLEE